MEYLNELDSYLKKKRKKKERKSMILDTHFNSKLFFLNILFIILNNILTMKMSIWQKNVYGMMWVTPIEIGLSTG